MITYPIKFEARAHSTAGIQSPWTFESQAFKNACAIPPEFEGPGGGFSPEDLFAQSLTNCFIATFKVYAEKSKVSFGQLEVNTELVVDLDGKTPVMKSCLLNVSISGCENIPRTKLLAEKAFSSGFIINSVKTEMHMNLQVTA